MGVLYARVAGQWVPVAPAGTVIPPAYVGFRSDVPTQARFGNTLVADERMGVLVESNGGQTYLVPFGQGQRLYERSSDDTVWTRYADLNNVRGTSQVQGLGLGANGAYGGRPGIWPHGQGTVANGYMVMGESDNSWTYVNAKNIGHLRINNSNVMLWQADGIYPAKRLIVHFNRAAGDWAQAQQIVWADQSGSNLGAAITMHQEGYWAWVLRCSQWDNGIACVNSQNNAYGPFIASAFSVPSSETFKTDVRQLDVYQPRSIGLERERIVVRHDPQSDVVPEVDVMALRPVAFRPKVGTLRPDGTEWEPDTWPGIEGRRERLGLIAEDVQTLIPSAVSHGAEGNVIGIDYAQITVALLAHVQRLTEEVATLRYRVAELEGAPA